MDRRSVSPGFWVVTVMKLVFSDDSLLGVLKAFGDYEVIEQRKYTPDGVMGNVWFEVKGRFRTRHEMDKYIHVRRSNPMAVIIFVLHSERVGLPGAKKRKDGTRKCMEDWLEENDFAYTYEDRMQHFMDNFNKGMT